MEDWSYQTKYTYWAGSLAGYYQQRCSRPTVRQNRSVKDAQTLLDKTCFLSFLPAFHLAKQTRAVGKNINFWLVLYLLLWNLSCDYDNYMMIPNCKGTIIQMFPTCPNISQEKNHQLPPDSFSGSISELSCFKTWHRHSGPGRPTLGRLVGTARLDDFWVARTEGCQTCSYLFVIVDGDRAWLCQFWRRSRSSPFVWLLNVPSNKAKTFETEPVCCSQSYE